MRRAKKEACQTKSTSVSRDVRSPAKAAALSLAVRTTPLPQIYHMCIYVYTQTNKHMSISLSLHIIYTYIIC